MEGGGRMLSWQLKDVPKIVPEPYMPSELEVIKMVQVSTFSDWKDFGVWYWKLANKKCQIDKNIKEKVTDLVKDVKTLTEKVRAIYNWVVTDITYEALEVAIHGWQPYDTRTIFSRGYGDCKDKATLLKAMLGEVGIEAYPVLIRMENVRHEEDLSLPMFSHFNHMICYLPPTDEWKNGWFLDGTAQYVPANFIPSGDAGAKVAVIKPDGAEIIRIPFHTPESNQTIQHYRISLLHDGSGTVEIKAEEPGEFGPYWRNRLSQPDMRKDRIEQTFSGRFPGAKYLEGEFSDLENLDKTVKFKVILKSSKLIEETAGGIRLRNVVQPLELSSFSSSPKRDYDVVFDSPYRKKDTVVYEIPDTFKVKSLPDDIMRESVVGRYELKHKSEAGRITITRIFDRKAARISKDKYMEFRKFCNEIDAAERGSIVLEKMGGER
jgi:hypothetical protein